MQGYLYALLFHEEAINGLLLAHELNDLAVEVHKKGPTEATGNPEREEERARLIKGTIWEGRAIEG